MATPSVPSVRSKDELVKEFRRSEIVRAARGLIAEVGIADSSMERIAQLAGVAKGTLYLYFESKDELIESALEYTYQELIERCRAATANRAAPIERVRAIATAILAAHAEHRAFARALADRPELSAEGPSPASERLRRCLEPFVDLVVAVFEDGIREGVFRPVGARRAARSFLVLIRSLVMEQLREPSPPDPFEELEALLDVLLHGVAAEGA